MSDDHSHVDHVSACFHELAKLSSNIDTILWQLTQFRVDMREEIILETK